MCRVFETKCVCVVCFQAVDDAVDLLRKPQQQRAFWEEERERGREKTERKGEIEREGEERERSEREDWGLCVG